MIKIVAKSVIKTEQVEKYLTLAKELVDKSRKEEGCISYGLFQDINDSSILTFIEEWQDEKAINLHNNSEHFTRIVPLLGELRVGNGEVNLYKEI
ncbi:putative quinol monooxygenase [Clostridium beijerinckii]|uniref:Putative monooxygenase YcnE n=1 Tax=Clostridium beijerinckii TaxID=1520 RepID=A0A1S8SB70_CLOBE|nr:putative quinol monooxygenase [Clostridium beijerinckii]NRY60288.1 quinol monooxygenase YgiN [Clostridium beijerinckii]OOM62542.1 putative monooxygenase YcnE [Clostridium beijerinckii]